MKKYVLASVVVVVLTCLVLLALSGPGGPSLKGVSLLTTDSSTLSDRTYDFLEDIKYKDFARASTYHLPKTQKERNIPELLRRIFQVRHEILDVTSFKILDVDFDRAGKRARVRTQVFFRVLGDERMRENQNNDRNVEILFYWFEQADGAWVMELESSLR